MVTSEAVPACSTACVVIFSRTSSRIVGSVATSPTETSVRIVASGCCPRSGETICSTRAWISTVVTVLSLSNSSPNSIAFSLIVGRASAFSSIVFRSWSGRPDRPPATSHPDRGRRSSRYGPRDDPVENGVGRLADRRDHRDDLQELLAEHRVPPGQSLSREGNRRGRISRGGDADDSEKTGYDRHQGAENECDPLTGEQAVVFDDRLDWRGAGTCHRIGLLTGVNALGVQSVVGYTAGRCAREHVSDRTNMFGSPTVRRTRPPPPLSIGDRSPSVLTSTPESDGINHILRYKIRGKNPPQVPNREIYKAPIV